jgi:hypothetical protein
VLLTLISFFKTILLPRFEYILESSGLTFEEFENVFHDYLVEHPKVPGALEKTLTDLFDGQINKVSYSVYAYYILPVSAAHGVGHLDGNLHG